MRTVDPEPKQKRDSGLRVLGLYLCSTALSLAAIALPAYVSNLSANGGGLCVHIRAGYESYSALTAVLLLVVGIVLGVVSRQRLEFLVVAAAMPLPIWIFAETFMGPAPSNLWPLEALMSCFAALPTIGGVWLGRLARPLPRQGRHVD